MKKKILFWVISIVLTIFLAAYQRITGPTYPVKGSFTLENQTIKYQLPRSSDGNEHTFVTININDPSVRGILSWKRFKTADDYSNIEMKTNNGKLEAELPKQPAAGKLQYVVKIQKGDNVVSIPDKEPVVLRFRDPVSPWVLFPHIFTIFMAMLLSTRTGLEYFNDKPSLKNHTLATLIFLIAGGFILGPIMQYYSFGAFWTGIPFGFDLTDNKTLIALIAWVIVGFRLKKSKNPKRMVLIAAIVMFLVYLIPHSVLGSELNYNKMDQEKMESTQLPVKN
jgi:hypothetical protein